MQAGSLYYHFDSRDDLVEEILQLGVANGWVHVRAALAKVEGATSKVQLATALRAHTSAVLDEVDYVGVLAGLLSQVPPDVRTRHMESHREYGDFFGVLFDQASADGHLIVGCNPTLLRYLAMGAPVQLAEWWFRPGPRALTSTDVADELMRMVFTEPATE